MFVAGSDSLGCYGLDIGTNLGELLSVINTINDDTLIGLRDIAPASFLRYFEEIDVLLLQSVFR